jgi:hypothetical protein
MVKRYPIFEISLLILILAVACFLMLRSAWEESAIMDEIAHIPAGYGYIKFLDYRLNPEHPPLVKALAALPLLKLDLKFPNDHKSWTENVNGQWEMGGDFLYRSGNNADAIIFWSRLFPIILTLLTTVIIFIWSREILGSLWSLLPTLFFALSPTVLAHGHYVTTDTGATLGILAATYFFLKHLLRPLPASLIKSGVALGIAALTKFSVVILIPLFVLLTIAWSVGEMLRGQKVGLKTFMPRIGGTIVIFTIALIVIYVIYFFFTFNYPPEKQFRDSEFILKSFSPHFLAEINLQMIKNPVLRPLAHYLLGFLMVLQRSAGGNTGYFWGEVSAAGSPFYFPTVYLLKEPLPVLIIVFLALSLALKNIAGKINLKTFGEYLGLRFPEFSMITFVVIYWGYSIRSHLNIGFRHLLPTIPFIYILATSGIKNWFENNKTRSKRIFIFIAILWFLGEIFFAAPHFLPYFNELAGGSNEGYRYVTDSNYDWGQDLKRLKIFVEKWNKEHSDKINKIAVDYFGGGDPKYYLGNLAEYWWSAKGNPKDEGIEWLAVSINTLQGALGKLHPGQPRKTEDEYRWLKEWRSPPKILGGVPPPDFRAGKSIFIYRLK